MKNGINTGQFRVKTESLGNGWKNSSPIFINTKTRLANMKMNGQKWKTEQIRTGRPFFTLALLLLVMRAFRCCPAGATSDPGGPTAPAVPHCAGHSAARTLSCTGRLYKEKRRGCGRPYVKQVAPAASCLEAVPHWRTSCKLTEPCMVLHG
jgi:hypothetical protein